MLFIGTLVSFSVIAARNLTLFSPYDKPTTKLIDQIRQAKISIHAAVYMITDKDIAQALIDAYKRGIDVRIITDVISTGKYGKADFLAENGIRVYVLDVNAQPTRTTTLDQNQQASRNEKKQEKKLSGKMLNDDRWFSNDPIMHHKFMIVDGVYLWTGSFNWTGAANKKNHENVLTTNDRETCKIYEQQFSRIIDDGSCKPYYPGRISAYMPTSLAGKVMAAISQINEEGELAKELLEIVNNHQLCTLKA